MSKTYHRHGDEIHIEAKDDNGVVIDHSCIALVNAARPGWVEHADYILLACNAHEKLLARLNEATCPYCNGPCGKRDPDQYHCRWCDETRAITAAAMA